MILKATKGLLSTCAETFILNNNTWFFNQIYPIFYYGSKKKINVVLKMFELSKKSYYFLCYSGCNLLVFKQNILLCIYIIIMTDSTKSLAQKLSKAQLTKFTSDFMFSRPEQIPFTTTAADIIERNRLRRNFYIIAIGGGILSNSIGFAIAKKLPKYKMFIIPGFATLSLVIITGKYLETMKTAKKYLYRKFKTAVAA